MFLIPYIAVIIGVLVIISLKRGAVFLPMRRGAVDKMVRLLEIKPRDKAVDLGSGDGRVVLALARAGAEAHGYEHNPFLVWWSRFRIYRAGLSGRAFIHRGNFWKIDLSEFSVVTVFGISYVMKPLEEKLLREAYLGTRVASYVFKFPSLKPVTTNGGVSIYSLQGQALE